MGDVRKAHRFAFLLLGKIGISFSDGKKKVTPGKVPVESLLKTCIDKTHAVCSLFPLFTEGTACIMSHAAVSPRILLSRPSVRIVDEVSYEGRPSSCSPFTAPASAAAVSCNIAPATVKTGRDVKGDQSTATALPMTETAEMCCEMSKEEREILIRKMHLDLSAVEANTSEKIDEEGYHPSTPVAKLLYRHDRKKPILRRIGAACTHLKIVVMSVLFLFLVAVALLVVCIVAANES